jgi:hypothetical protein
MGTIRAEDALSAMETIMAAGLGQAAILPIDWTVMRAAGPLPALLRGMAPDEQAAAEPVAAVARASARPATRAALAAAIGAACAGLLMAAGAPDPRRPLHDLGLDSLGSLELRNRLGRIIGEVLPVTVLFDYPTIAALTRFLGDRTGLPADEPGSSAATVEIMALTDDLEALSDEALDAVLAGYERLLADSPQ